MRVPPVPRAAGAAAMAAGAAWSLPGLAPVAPPVARALGIARACPGAPAPLLTFDDGPHPQGTPAVLDRLDSAQVRAAFFLVGEQVARDPGLAREVADRGHAIGIHGHRHRNLLRLAPRALAADLERAETTIRAATGAEPGLYRPPYGIFSAATVREVRRRGWTPLLWTRWGRDWARGATPDSVAALVLGDGLRAGDVVLLHDSDAYSAPGSWRTTVLALDRILTRR